MPRPTRFRDAHTHLSAGAADLADVDLRDTGTAAEVSARVAAAIRAREPGAWLRGWGWSGLAAIEPGRQGENELDRLAPRNPVFLARADGHAAWVNRAACDALSIPRDRVTVEEEEFEAARRRLPPLTAAARSSALRARLAAFEARGIAVVDDFVEPWGPDTYASLAHRDALPVAIGLWLPETLDPADAEALRRAFPAGATPIAVRGIKLFLDGTLGARTAALSRPYADDPGRSGGLRISELEIVDRVARWAAHDWPVALHAIGDRAVSLALDALERVPRPTHSAHRIEHAQVVRRADLPRFGRAGVVASVQPGHWRDDRPFLLARLGSRPDVVAHPLASLARAGATLVFGSDWPVSTFDPGSIAEAAVDPDRGDEALSRGAASAAASA